VAAAVVAYATLARADCADRREILRAEAHNGRVWGYGWAVANGAAAVANGAAIPFFDHDTQIDLAFSAGKGVVGAVSTLVSPVTHLHVMEDCNEVERELARAADAEAFGKSWLSHAGNLLFNVGVALTLGFGWDHWRAAAIDGAIGTVVGEAMIYTQPGGAMQVTFEPTSGGMMLMIAGAF
jgi:hypothetical protein